MSFSDNRRSKAVLEQAPSVPPTYPHDSLAQRLSETSDSGSGGFGGSVDPEPSGRPGGSPRRDLEQLVSLLARRNIHADGRLTKALEGLERWTDRAASSLEAAAASSAARPEPTPPAEAARTPDATDDMELRIGALARSLMTSKTETVAEAAPALEAAPAPARPVSAAHPVPAAQPVSAPQPVASLRAALAQIAARQKDLDEVEPERAAPPSSPLASPAPTSLAPASPPPPAPPALDAAPVHELRRQIDTLGLAVAGLPTRADVDGLLRDVAALAARDADPRPARLDADTLRAIEALVSEVERMRGDAASPQLIARFSDEIAAVSAKLEASGSHAAIVGLAARVEDIRAELARFPRVEAVEDLAADVQALVARIDRQERAAEARADDVERVAAVVRTELAALTQPGAIEDIGRKIEALTAELAKRGSVTADVGPLAAKVDSLGEKVDDVAAEARAQGVSFERIEDAVRGIAEHLVATSHAPSGSDQLGGIESRIDQLVQTLDRSDGRVDDLNAGFAALAARIEQSVVESALDAGRSAAAAVRESFIEQGSADGVDASQLAQALGELRDAASRNDRRTADTLDAVRVTLERLVDRLETGGFAQDRSARSPEAPIYDARPAPERAPVVDATEAARAAARRAIAEIDLEQELAPARTRANRPEPLDGLAPDHPLEPGGMLRPRNVADAAPEVAPASRAASFIAAARRATVQPSEDEPSAAEPAGGRRLGSGLTALKARRKPLLIALAAVLIVLGVVRFASGLNDAPVAMAPEPAAQSDMAPAAPQAATPAPAPSAPELSPSAPTAGDPPPATEAPPPAPKPGARLSPPRAPAADMTDFAFAQSLGGGAQTFARPAAGDDFATGSIGRGADALPDSIGGAMLRMRAVQGDPSAQLEIADRLADGRGAPANPVAAVRWLEKAAAQGLAPAQHRLGSMYEKGRGVPRDIMAARRWYEQAAASGNVRAMHNLGVIHAEGGLGKPDFNAAIVWFRMAAERGLVDSQYNLGVLEARGLGGKRDLAAAYKWFALADAQGDQDAGRKRDEVAKTLGAGLAAARQAVANFRPRAIDGSANEAPAPAGGWDQASARAGAPAASR